MLSPSLGRSLKYGFYKNVMSAHGAENVVFITVLRLFLWVLFLIMWLKCAFYMGINVCFNVA